MSCNASGSAQLSSTAPSVMRHIDAQLINVSLGLALPALFPLSFNSCLPGATNVTAGCNRCPECKQLKDFLANAESTEIRFVTAQKTRSHLELYISVAGISNFVTTETIKRGTPHTLLVAKRPEFAAQLTWNKAQGDATAFVRSVAEGQELKEIMRERYDDVLSALQGTKAFIYASDPAVIATSDMHAAAPPTSVNPSHEVPVLQDSESLHHTAPPSGSNGTSVHEQPGPSSVAAGTKRKHSNLPPNTVAVIDLT
ncbi:hypothetical protein NMY22_g18628 [Coprinellus aureogranulatus]|nr:hypothetical protein NMY22_g18628 [Coprinellus aureogranulatus]